MSLDTISLADLSRVTGGAPNPPPNNGGEPPTSGLKKAGKVAKLIAKRAGPIGAAWTAYDGVSGFIDARKQGKSIGESLKDGALNAIW